MKNKTMLSFAKILILFFVAFNANAINLIVTNSAVSLDPLIVTNTFTVSVDIMNSTDATTAEDAQTIEVNINNFGIDVDADFGFIPGSESFGWTCLPTGVPVTSLTCTKVYTIPPFTADSLTTESLSFDMVAGAVAIPMVVFNINVLDTAIGFDDSPADNSSIINTSLSGAMLPDLDFVNASTPAIYSAVENQVALVEMDFQLTNNGVSASSGASVSIFYDDNIHSFSLGSSSIPAGWACGAGSGSVDCSTFDAVTNGSLTNFQMAFSIGASGTYLFSADALVINLVEGNTNNNGISTNLIVAPANPDLSMALISPVTSPVDVEEGTMPVTPFVYRVENIGNTTFQPNGIEVLVSNDVGFVITNVQTSAIGWSCLPDAGGFKCTNDSSSITPMNQVEFTGDIIGYPAVVNLYPNAVQALVSDLSMSESNLIDNSESIAVDISSAVNETNLNLKMSVKDMPNGTIITNVDQNVPFVYSIQVNNPSVVAANNIIVIDDLPVGIMADNVQNSSQGLWSCSVDAFVSVLISQRVTCTHPGIAAGVDPFNEFIYIDVQGLVLGGFNNSATATSDEVDSDILDNTNSQMVVIDAAQTVDITLANELTAGVMVNGQGVLEAEVGSEVVYKILVNNNGFGGMQATKTSRGLPIDTANNVVITNVLPANLTYIGPAGQSLELGPNFSCNVNANTITCTALTLPSGVMADDGFEFIARVDALVNDVIVNTANVTADNIAVNNMASSLPFTVIPASGETVDLVMSKEAQTLAGVSAVEFDVGENFKYALTVTNSGIDAAAAAEVVVTDVVPIGIDIVSIISSVGWDCSASDFPNRVIDCINIMAINSAGSSNIVIEVSSQTPGNYINTASVALDGNSMATDINTNNNNDNVGVDIFAVGGGLSFTKSVIGGTDNGGVIEFTQGELFIYSLTIDNLTKTIFSDLVVTDSIGVGSLFVQSIPSGIPGFDCSVAGNDVTCSQNGTVPLNPGEQVIIDIDVITSALGANIGNIANVSSSIEGLDLDSNNVDVSIFPLSSNEVNLNILKDARMIGSKVSANNFSVNEIFEYKLVVHNTGPSDAPIGEVEVIDILPVGMDLAQVPSSVEWDCSGTVGNNVRCLNTVIIPAKTGFLTIIVPVSSAVNNTYLNTADVSLVAGATAVELDLSDNSGNFNVTINPVVGGLTLVKSVTGGSVLSRNSKRLPNPNFAIGDTVTYTLLAENTPVGNPVPDLIVKDTLDVGFLDFLSMNIIQSSANFTCDYDGTSSISCTNQSGGSFQPGDKFEVEIKATAIASGTNIANTANLSSIMTGDAFNSNTVFIDIDSGVLPTTLSITKEAVVDGLPVVSITKGNAYQYQINVTNSGSDDAINVEVVDNMPMGVIVNNSFGTNWSCSNVNQEYTCQLSTPLAAGASTVLTFDVSDASAAAITQLTNNVSTHADNAPLQSISNTINLTLVGLSLNITQNPDPVVENANFDFIVDISNTGTEVLQGVQMINTLPTGFSYRVKSRSSTCSINGLVMTCSVDADIAVGAMESIVIPVKAIAAVDTNVNYINMNSISGTNFVSVVSENTVINIDPAGTLDFTININDNIDPVVVGSPFIYTVSTENTGNLPITNFDFSVMVDSELLVSSSSSNGVTCTVTNNVLNCNANAGFNLLPGASMTLLSIDVQSPSFVGEVQSTVSALAEEGSNATANETTTIIPQATDTTDLSLIKTASESEVLINTPFMYQLTVSNNSKIDATGVTVIDNLPKGLVLDSIDAPNWTCKESGSVICSNELVSANSTSVINLMVTAPAQSGKLINTAVVSSNESDSNSANNNSQVNVTITEPDVLDMADLTITKSASVDSLISGQSFSWTIEVFNNGPTQANNIVINDQLPIGFDLISVVNPKGSTCTSSKNTVNCNLPSLNDHESMTVQLLGSVSLASGLLDNMVTVTSDTKDPDSSNNSDMASVNVEAVAPINADLSIQISNEEAINQGENIDFSIDIANNGPDAASHPEFMFSVTGLVKFISVSANKHWNCQVANLNASCQFNDETMSSGFASNIVVSVHTSPLTDQSQNINVNASVSSTTNDKNLTNNMDSSQVNVAGTPTEEEIFTALREALGGLANEQTIQAIENVSSYCEKTYIMALEGLCSELYQAALDGDGETINNFMTQITPNEIIGQSSSVSEIATAQFRNVGSRLSQLRSGGGSGFSTAGLTARYGNGSIPLGMLSYLNQTDDEVDGITNVDNDFISPWGFFVNGTISMGERDATGRELGFDFDTFGMTAGFDYRLDAKKVIGIALGYASFESTIEETAKLESTGITLTGYGSFYVNDNFYVDARISVGRPDFDQSRKIDFTLGETQVNRTAVGKTDASQYSVAMSAGYSFYKNAWNITPNASFRYVSTTINGFTETGAGDFDFEFFDQDLESLVWSAGIRMSKAISLKSGVITPQFDFDVNYESLNDGGDIEARFVMAPDDEIFIIETDSPDRTYGSAGLGLVYISANGKQAYINYRSILGLEGFSRGTFNLGARFEF